MRKLSVMVAALFLLGSAPAFAQTSGTSAGTESGSAMSADGGTESGAATGKKMHHKKMKKTAKKKKGTKAESTDAGM